MGMPSPWSDARKGAPKPLRLKARIRFGQRRYMTVRITAQFHASHTAPTVALAWAGSKNSLTFRQRNAPACARGPPIPHHPLKTVIFRPFLRSPSTTSAHANS
jgi:hypothetical protein